MATLPIPGLLVEFVVLGLQAVDKGAQLSHFRAQVLHREDQFREEMTGKTDLYQLAIHEPHPPPKRFSMREERAMLRALLDLPPSERG